MNIFRTEAKNVPEEKKVQILMRMLDTTAEDGFANRIPSKGSTDQKFSHVVSNYPVILENRHQVFGQDPAILQSPADKKETGEISRVDLRENLIGPTSRNISSNEHKGFLYVSDLKYPMYHSGS